MRAGQPPQSFPQAAVRCLLESGIHTAPNQIVGPAHAFAVFAGRQQKLFRRNEMSTAILAYRCLYEVLAQ